MAQVLQAALPAQTAAGADSTTELGGIETVQGTDNYLKSVTLYPPPGYTTSTANASNFVTFTVRQRRANASVVADVASFSSTATSIVAETPISLTIDETTAQQSGLQQGDILDVLMHQTGTGVAVGAGIIAEAAIS